MTPGGRDPLGSESALQRAVRTMDRLRSPGGCPWDAAQTHGSLAPYLLEEAYETLDAIETGDLQALREELGDLLLQVLFHARLAEEAPAADRFGIDDVAADLVAKLERRHPHVFGDTVAPTAADVNANWERIKRAEKRRSSVTDGVPAGQPALAWAAALLSRASRAALPTGLHTPAGTAAGSAIGDELFAVVRAAVAAGVDPEQALRRTVHRYRAAVLAAEAARAADDGGNATEREPGTATRPPTSERRANE